MRTLIFDCIAVAKTGISHNGGEKNGNMGLFRTERMMYEKDGELKSVRVPQVSANSLRSMLREQSAEIYLADLGLLEKGKSLVNSSINLLFSGGGKLGDKQGALEEILKKINGKKTTEVGDVLFEQMLRENNLPLSLFGCALDKTMIQGKADVMPLITIGQETCHIVPDALKDKLPKGLPKVGYYLSNRFNTTKGNENNIKALRLKMTKDDMIDVILAKENFETEVLPTIAKHFGVKLSTKEQAKSYLDNVENVEPILQMLYYTQILIPGTPLYWKICLRDVTDAEFDLFMQCIERLKDGLKVGGKHSNGLGEIEIKDIVWRDVSLTDNKLDVSDKNTFAIYQQFMQNKKDAVLEFIDKL